MGVRSTGQHVGGVRDTPRSSFALAHGERRASGSKRTPIQGPPQHRVSDSSPRDGKNGSTRQARARAIGLKGGGGVSSVSSRSSGDGRNIDGEEVGKGDEEFSYYDVPPSARNVVDAESKGGGDGGSRSKSRRKAVRGSKSSGGERKTNGGARINASKGGNSRNASAAKSATSDSLPDVRRQKSPAGARNQQSRTISRPSSSMRSSQLTNGRRASFDGGRGTDT
jgi:hypothetical protein